MQFARVFTHEQQEWRNSQRPSMRDNSRKQSIAILRLDVMYSLFVAQCVLL